MKTAAATATFASLPAQAAGEATQFRVFRRDGIATLFDDLPGDLGFKIHAPSPRGRPGFNTATDMIFNLVGADNIRKLIASAGLLQTRVPDNTRIFSGYVFGADNYKTITWAQLLELVEASEGRFANPFLNDVETLASTAEDFVTYYSQALQGGFFQHGATLQEFRRILTLCDFIYLIPVPLGVSAYAKSGNVDIAGFHARAFAGGMFFANHWVYFAFILNWYAPEGDDPQTVQKFFAAIHEALTRVRDALS